jgi:hypothetical protein
MDIQYTNNFYQLANLRSKALQNIVKLDFLVRKYTIWQPLLRTQVIN